jgi:F420-non-reducing hydrogenase small subunit
MAGGEEIFGSLFKKGEVVFKQGEQGDTMYIIQSGAVEISQEQDGKDVVLALLDQGDFFGEMALLQDEVRSATVRAIQKTRLLPFSRGSLMERLKTDPGVAVHLMKGLILRIQQANENVRFKVEQDDDLRVAITGIEEDKDSKASPPVDKGAGTSEKADRGGPQDDDIQVSDIARLWQVESELSSFSDGDHVFSEGDHGDTMYIIAEGAVQICQGSGQETRVLASLVAGDFFGEMSIITDSARNASAVSMGRTKLLPIMRKDMNERISQRPELALFIIQSLIRRLRKNESFLQDPEASLEEMRKHWQPLLKKSKIKVAILSLSTCAGCSSVLLDELVLDQIAEHADIVYCPMLMDRDSFVEADVTLIDGLVRLTEEQERLLEARLKSKYLVAWGTCAAYGGIPAKANRYELEELIEETYGHAADTFSYYMSGKGGVSTGVTYQEEGVSLMRQAYRVDNFTRVDYYLPGCPPNPEILLQLTGELMGDELTKTKAIVCSECSRKPTKDPVAALRAFPSPDADPAKCFNSTGTICMGFTVKGGCGASCTSNGLPCWGCRGPSNSAYKKMFEGLSFEEVLAKGLSQRCKLDETEVRNTVKAVRKQDHSLYSFEHTVQRNLSRFR